MDPDNVPPGSMHLDTCTMLMLRQAQVDDLTDRTDQAVVRVESSMAGDKLPADVTGTDRGS
jgi:hypothetical protein